MQTTVFLHQAADAEDSFAIALPGDTRGGWRAQKGFGSNFKKVWTIELQSAEPPSIQAIDWDQVLLRAIEAYTMNDPIITNFAWPLLDRESRASAS
jgi:hypothetical protein